MRMVFDPALLGLLSSSRLPSARPQQDEKVELSADALVRQLEGRWHGIGMLTENRKRAFLQLTDHVRGISADRSYLDYQLGLRGIDEDAIAMIEECTLNHAYLATVTIALIAMAKEARGILPSVDFFWTRNSDPAFWLMINGYGRPGHLAGIVGAFVHHAAEKRYGRPITKTYFDISTVTVGEKVVLEPDEARIKEFEESPHSFF